MLPFNSESVVEVVEMSPTNDVQNAENGGARKNDEVVFK